MKIHIFGASGSGVTTLGNHLSSLFQLSYADSDNFFWEDSNPPFTIKRNPELRNHSILQTLDQHQNWILGGSIINWDLNLNFDLIIFLWIPNEIRMERLKKREEERYGTIIYTDKKRHKQYLEFLDWAANYENPAAKGRSLQAHENWIKQQNSPLLEIRGDLSVQERTSLIKAKLMQYPKIQEQLNC